MTSNKPILTVEFSAGSRDEGFKEESVTLHSPDEFFAFVAPGGGCEAIPEEVEEIRMVFLEPSNPNVQNPIADLHASLQMGMVIFHGPLAELVQTADRILDKAGRGELSESFMAVIGARR